jgi:UTP-glucose-1-phosphate uridylyltransferase
MWLAVILLVPLLQQHQCELLADWRLPHRLPPVFEEARQPAVAVAGIVLLVPLVRVVDCVLQEQFLVAVHVLEGIARGWCVAKQLIDIHEETRCSVFSVQEVPREEISRYGAVEGDPVAHRSGLRRGHSNVEKPRPEAARSHLAPMGRYVFTPRILEILQETPPGVNGEIQLTDAMAALAKREMVYAWEFLGRRLDVGSVEGFLEANLVIALDRPGMRERLAAIVAENNEAGSAAVGKGGPRKQVQA